jgi:DNA-binding beta-propeller fold protein YncE
MHTAPARRLAAGLVFLAPAAIALCSAQPALASPSFTAFESGQVRPLALSPDKKTLFAVNTPDGRLEVFRINGSGLAHRASIPVGLEPVAVTARSNSEVWVVNHLSDSVSVVKLDPGEWSGRVVRTLLVGDEPRDIVFAGPGRSRAFITTAHRGQNSPVDPQLFTPGVGRADVWVFDADNLGPSLGGNPLTIVNLFSDTPRALAVSPDGNRVYAAGFHTGNRTTTINELLIPDGGEANGGLPGPRTNADGVPAPETSLIVKFNGSHWVDELGRTWDDKVKFSLPDKDVFVLDATANPPAQVPGAGGFYTGVGTILYNIAVNPVSGKLYISNTDARNQERFEGPGIFAGHSVRGHFAENRITVVGSQGVAPRHLNKHINYASCCAPTPNAESAKSLALPTGMAVSSDGKTLYVAALGSGKVGVYSTASLEADTFVPNEADQIAVSGGGPTGLVLDDGKKRLYVLTRFDNSISIIDTKARAEIGHVAMHNPEPPSITHGRRFLYDATLSSHGDSACASCHVFGDLDSLAWDLGNPDGEVIDDPGPFASTLFNPFTGQTLPKTLHPMKGPMTTQSLRGMANHGPMHWRGDRTGGSDAPSIQPDSGAFDEVAAFKKFQGGFIDLLGRDGPIPDDDMQAFADFILQVTYPPNPIRKLDNSLTPDQQAGADLFFGDRHFDILETCTGCHTTDVNGNPGTAHPGFFGTSGLTGQSFQPQNMKVPHLRNLYQKVGMFGFAPVPGLILDPTPFMGDQVRGFGFLHDGSVDTTFRFHRTIVFSENPFNAEGFPISPAGDEEIRNVESFLMAFPSNMAPIVGQQVTLTAENKAVAGPRIDLLMSRASVGECDLIAKYQLGSLGIGFLYVGGGEFLTDREVVPAIPDSVVRSFASLPGGSMTYTCVPPGSGVRMGIDRDEDGALDGDELDAGSDPTDPDSVP